MNEPRDASKSSSSSVASGVSERAFHALTEHVSDVVSIVNPDGTFRYLSPSSTLVTGFSVEEMIGRSLTESVHPDDVEDARKIFADAMQGGNYAVPQPVRRQHRNGEWRTLEVTVYGMMQDPDVRGVVVIARDLTARYRAEQRVADELAFNETVLAASPVGFATFDADLRMVSANAALVRITGGTVEALLSLDYRAQESWKKSGILAAAERALRERVETSIEAAVTSSFGKEVWILVRFVPFLHGGKNHLLMVVEDVAERRKAERELAVSRDFYLTLFEDFPALIWRAGPDLKTNYFNRAWLQFTGRTLEQETGRGWLENVHSDDVALCEGATRDFVRKRKPFTVEYRLRHHTGSYRWILETAKPFHDPDGNFAGYIGVCQDITDRHESEDQLRLQSSALGAAANGILITDRIGRIQWVNAAFTALTGYEAAEAIGKTTRLLKSGMHDDTFYRNLWQTILGGQVWRGELINRRKDGQLYAEEMTITPVRNQAGEISHFIAIKQDISRQRRAAEKLREQAALLDLTQDSITVRDMDDRITYWNKSAEKLYGASPGKAIGRSMKDLVPELDSARVHEARETALLTGQWAGEIQLVTGGQRRTIDSKWTLIRDDGGHPSAMLCVDNDITERKRFAEHFATADRMKSLGTLVSGIAHDFNNLLMPILGLSDLIIANPHLLKDEADVLSHLRDINSAAHEARDIVRRLREFYRPDDKLEREPVDLARIIEAAVVLAQPRWKTEAQAEGRTITIEREFSAVPQVHGNEARLREAILSLILNAVDALPAGGIIRLRLLERDGQAVMEVQDNGVGMSDEVRRRCLEPFFSTKDDHGSGLGLSVCHGIVRQHRGRLDIDSHVGIGTTMRITLPCQEPLANGRAAGTAVRSHVPGQPLRVLVIDDDDLSRDMLRLFLVSERHEVSVASNGTDGLARLHEREFDLVITDRAMPGMNGDQVAIEVKRFSPLIMVVLLTGFGEMMTSKNERPEGIDLVLGKPLTRDELRDALAGLFATPPPEET